MTTTGAGDGSGGRRRNVRSAATRTRLLDAAERLYAEQGLGNVSNRTILEFAGEANKTALTYHFGSGDGLLRELLRRHSEAIAARCAERLALLDEAAGLRGAVAALVMSVTDYLEQLGPRSWCARLFSQVQADPRARAEDRAGLVPLDLAKRTVSAHLPGPPEVAALRLDATRIAVIGICAEQEGAAARTGVPAEWTLVGEVLTDLVVAMLTVPVRAG